MDEWPTIADQITDVRERLRKIMRGNGMNPAEVGAEADRHFPRSGWTVAKLLRSGAYKNPTVKTVLVAREILSRQTPVQASENLRMAGEGLTKYALARPAETQLVADARRTGRMGEVAALVRRIADIEDPVRRDEVLRFLKVLA